MAFLVCLALFLLVVAFLAWMVFELVLPAIMDFMDERRSETNPHKFEYETYKNAYEDMCAKYEKLRKQFAELLDKYEALYNEKGE